MQLNEWQLHSLTSNDNGVEWKSMWLKLESGTYEELFIPTFLFLAIQDVPVLFWNLVELNPRNWKINIINYNLVQLQLLANNPSLLMRHTLAISFTSIMLGGWVIPAELLHTCVMVNFICQIDWANECPDICVCLWECFWKRLACKLVDWLKQIAIRNLGGHSNLLRNWIERKGRGRANSLSDIVCWDINLLLH